jgi:hypothetical protein
VDIISGNCCGIIVIFFNLKNADSCYRLCLDVVLTYEQQLKSEWWSLPKNLQMVLHDRLEQYSVHSLF